MIRKKLMMLLVSVALISLTANAFADCCQGGCNDCCVACPQCNTCCKLDVKEENVDKHCWKVECEEICIPCIVFPWQKSCCNPCANNGAKVKTVRVLKKHSYECPTCKYSWTPVKNGCGNGCCAAGCGNGCCDAGGADGAAVPFDDGQPMPAAEVPTQPIADPVPGFFDSAKRVSSKIVLPVRFLQAARDRQ